MIVEVEEVLINAFVVARKREDTSRSCVHLSAADSCYVISVDSSLDGTTDRLSKVIPRVYARKKGTIISCVPGRLAYYEGEPPENRFILTR